MDEELQQAQAEAERAQDAAQAGAPQDPQGAEAERAQDARGGEGATVNAHKHERDIANRDRRIRELEERLEEATGGRKTAEDRISEIEAKLAAMEEERDAAKADAALAASGCVDCELGRAALKACGGDVERLKAAKPYLFAAERKTVSTGGDPVGGAGDDTDRMRRIAGLPPRK